MSASSEDEQYKNNGETGNSNGEASTFKPFTKAERIQQLNDIDKSISQLLKAAGLAIRTLTQTKASALNASSPEEHREAFKTASNTYLTTLNSVDIRLRRQAYGLEEAGIIAADKSTDAKKRDGAADGTDGKATENFLDIGLLNSRSGKVARNMEADLWSQALQFLDDLDKRKSNGTSNGANHGADEDGDEKMGSS